MTKKTVDVSALSIGDKRPIRGHPWYTITTLGQICHSSSKKAPKRGVGDRGLAWVWLKTKDGYSKHYIIDLMVSTFKSKCQLMKYQTIISILKQKQLVSSTSSE
jgi:hypothetical protein